MHFSVTIQILNNKNRPFDAFAQNLASPFFLFVFFFIILFQVSMSCAVRDIILCKYHTYSIMAMQLCHFIYI